MKYTNTISNLNRNKSFNYDEVANLKKYENMKLDKFKKELDI